MKKQKQAKKREEDMYGIPDDGCFHVFYNREALAAYEQALHIRPGWISSQRGRSLVLRRLGR
jgi:hypothetical protein